MKDDRVAAKAKRRRRRRSCCLVFVLVLAISKADEEPKLGTEDCEQTLGGIGAGGVTGSTTFGFFGGQIERW